MSDYQGFLNHLIKYGKLKDESWEYLANKFGFNCPDSARSAWSRRKLDVGKDAIKEERADYVKTLENKITEFIVEGNKAEMKGAFDNEIKTLDELIEKCKIDINIWKIDRYVQNYWGNGNHPHWQVKAYLSKLAEKDVFQEEFRKFLLSYQPSSPKIERLPKRPVLQKKACLIINKQDEHINKFDIKGQNNMDVRFAVANLAMVEILRQAQWANYLDKVVYVIGSDQFNAEWTGLTTKGTPQENLLSYQESFQKVCDYEIQNITDILKHSNDVEVVYVSGNHDEYVGWHLVNWLKSYFRSEVRISFDISPRYRKYMRFGNSAIMFNHGDIMKPERLASVFPQEFKYDWSICENQYIFTGDKHREMSRDMDGIQWYQLSALSTASSLWDDKKGYLNSKREMTAFLIDESKGLTNIYKQPV